MVGAKLEQVPLGGAQQQHKGTRAGTDAHKASPEREEELSCAGDGVREQRPGRVWSVLTAAWSGAALRPVLCRDPPAAGTGPGAPRDCEWEQQSPGCPCTRGARVARGHCPVPALAQAGGTGLITGAEDTAKQGQALPAPLLPGSDLQLLVLPTDNGLKNSSSSFFSHFVFYLKSVPLQSC